MLKEGDIIVTGAIFGRVRAMTNDKGKRLTTSAIHAAEVIG
jgi:translation initiation factor IF-2